MNNILIQKIKNKLNKPISLVGLMGCGKSSVGRRLAQELSMDFVDSDSAIVQTAGMSIPEIFQTKGEAYFRDLEADTLKKLMLQDQGIIGTGGGAYMNENTRTLLNHNTISMFLHAELETLLKRVGNGEGRPLFKDKSPKDVLSDLVSERYPIYKQAQITIFTKNESVEETTNRVLQGLYNNLPDV